VSGARGPLRQILPAASIRGKIIGAGVIVAAVVGGCATDAASHARSGRVGVSHYGRPPGMPIGAGGAAETLDPLEPPPAEVIADGDSESPPAAGGVTPGVPCSGCVELNVYVDDINQRDEFAFQIDGSWVSKVIWTLRVNFNSDQLAVQPFIDGKYGKYTSLHVNTFPLGAPVQVEQAHEGKAHAIGLVVGSSGAWTGDQTMSVFVDSVRVEGKPGLEKTFAAGLEGLAPRTHQHAPQLVLHPAAPDSPGPSSAESPTDILGDSGAWGGDRRPSR
jgi:hypothetical protein